MENEQAWRVSIDQIKAGNFNLDLKNPHNPDTGPGDVDHLLPEYEKLLAQIAATRAALKQELHHALTAPPGCLNEAGIFFEKFDLFTDCADRTKCPRVGAAIGSKSPHCSARSGSMSQPHNVVAKTYDQRESQPHQELGRRVRTVSKG